MSRFLKVLKQSVKREHRHRDHNSEDLTKGQQSGSPSLVFGVDLSEHIIASKCEVPNVVR